MQMNRMRWVSSLFAGAVLLSGASLYAQVAGVSAPQDVAATKLDVSVVDKRGEPMQGLTPADFELTQDGRSLRLLNVVQKSAATEPTEMVILIDNVNSWQQLIAMDLKGLESFLTENDGKLALPTTLAISRDDGLQSDMKFTRDGNDLAKRLLDIRLGLQRYPQSAGTSGIQERSIRSLAAMSRIVEQEAQRPGRKIIVWISPGWPSVTAPWNHPTNDQQKRIFAGIVKINELMRRSNIQVDQVNVIGPTQNVSAENYYTGFLEPVRKSAGAEFEHLSLQVLTVHSGGAILRGNDAGLMLRQCVERSKAYYQVTFEAAPKTSDLAFHKVELSVRQPDATVATRPGYYSVP